MMRAPPHSGPESSQSWPKIKIAECDFLYFFRSLEKENILKYMIISIFNFSKEFKAVIYACKHEKKHDFCSKIDKSSNFENCVVTRGRRKHRGFYCLDQLHNGTWIRKIKIIKNIFRSFREKYH